MEINFFSEDIDFTLQSEDSVRKWIEKIALTHDATIQTLNYIFCSNDYLLNINKEYLQHDYFTDIISFPFAEHPQPLEGDIFISIDMVRENAANNSVNFENELFRVIAHGILHFLGFNDKTEDQQLMMRKKEDEVLALADQIQ